VKYFPSMHKLIIGLFPVSVTLLGVIPHICISLLFLMSCYVVKSCLSKVSRDYVILASFFLSMIMSGLVFGRIVPNFSVSAYDYFSGENRVLLYYIPALYILTLKTVDPDFFTRSIYFSFLFYLGLFIQDLLLKDSLFTSHHHKGILAALFVNFFFVKLKHHRLNLDMIVFFISLVMLIQSNSRTALLVTILTIIILNWRYLLRKARWGLFLFPIIFTLLMSSEAFKRIEVGLASANLDSLSYFFELGYSHSENIEVESAFDIRYLSYFSEPEMNNLTTRYVLWGKYASEFLMSPMIGVGLGNSNDLGREFCGIEHFVFFPCYTQEVNFSVLSAHNTFLSLLTELGVLFSSILFIFIRRVNSSANAFTIYGELSKAAITFVILSGFFNHSLAAPIYGFTFFYLFVIGSRLSNVNSSEKYF